MKNEFFNQSGRKPLLCWLVGVSSTHKAGSSTAQRQTWCLHFVTDGLEREDESETRIALPVTAARATAVRGNRPPPSPWKPWLSNMRNARPRAGQRAPASAGFSAGAGLRQAILIVCRLDFSTFGRVSSSMPSFNCALAFDASTAHGSVTVRLNSPLPISQR